VEVLLQIYSLMLLFTQYNTTWRTAISSRSLVTLPATAKVSGFNSYMQQNGTSADYRNMK